MNRSGHLVKTNRRCWLHRRRKARVCGLPSRVGYCRECWPVGDTQPRRNNYYLSGRDAALWLAA